MVCADVTRGRWPRICLLAVMLVLGQSAQAQWSDLMPETFALTREDMESQWVAARSLLDAPDARPGSEATWSNPRTGVHGTVTLLRLSEWQNMPCRRLRYTLASPRSADPMELSFTLCRAAEGAWKIAG